MKMLFAFSLLCFLAVNIQAQMPLTSVTHDSTLMGDGRSTSPLGVANGGISTAKLADGSVTAAKLAVGIGPLKVIDATNQEVGVYEFDSVRVLETAVHFFSASNVWVRLPISVNGDSFAPFNLTLYYETVDCTGAAYNDVSAGTNLLIQEAFPADGNAYFVTGSLLIKTVQSQSLAGSGVCTSASGTLGVKLVKSESLASFTFPFHVTR